MSENTVERLFGVASEHDVERPGFTGSGGDRRAILDALTSQEGEAAQMRVTDGVVRVLVVEDDPADAALIAAYLENVDSERFIVDWVQTLERATRFLQQRPCDMILLDLGLPDSEGAAGIQHLREVVAGVPLIAISGVCEEEVGLTVVQEGAQDFVSKRNLSPEVLARSIGYALERGRTEERLEAMALTDSLTGLWNRAYFDAQLRRLMREPSSHPDLAVLWIDLDRFKSVNDRWGHAAGDALLCAVAGRLVRSLREGDTVCRLGGDEFGVLLVDVSAEDARGVANKLLKSLCEPYRLEERVSNQSASIGVAALAAGEGELDAFVRAADAAMYAAKSAGRGKVCVHTEEMEEGIRFRLRLEEQLGEAVERREFDLAYQPIVEVDTGRIVGVEALARWTCEELGGEISPSRFIPAAEESGLIHALGTWVLDQAVAFAARLSAAGHDRIQVAVNLSPLQLNDQGLATELTDTLSRHGVCGTQLEFELTESVLMAEPDLVIPLLNELKACGVAISIDDFGTGYSSLAYLQDLPVDALKIDRHFVSRSAEDPGSARITKAVIGLAGGLGLDVVAEGVETVEQLEFLRASGCRRAQGYFLGRPTTADSVLRQLTDLSSGPEPE